MKRREFLGMIQLPIVAVAVHAPRVVTRFTLTDALEGAAQLGELEIRGPNRKPVSTRNPRFMGRTADGRALNVCADDVHSLVDVGGGWEMTLREGLWLEEVRA